MDWTAFLKDLGGEVGVLPALVMGGLSYACWHFMRRVSDLQDARVQDTKEALSETAKREAETITALNLINATLNAVMAQLQNGGRQ
jgi:hypothetical protein